MASLVFEGIECEYSVFEYVRMSVCVCVCVCVFKYLPSGNDLKLSSAQLPVIVSIKVFEKSVSRYDVHFKLWITESEDRI